MILLRWSAAVMEMISTDVITLYQYHTSHAVMLKGAKEDLTVTSKRKGQ